jgi:hypothetical protein|nr:MAG TPA: hypothetical protein [Caudoviricetes sp.]
MDNTYLIVWVIALALAVLIEEASFFLICGIFILLYAIFGWWGLGVFVLLVFIAVACDDYW